MLYLLWAYSHGLTEDRLRLYFNDFSRVPLALPGNEEQKKIADILDVVSQKIIVLAEKKAALEEYFVADCARSSGFDGIRYPSTRTAEGSHNLVVWNRDLSLGQGSRIQKMSVFDGKKLKSIAP